MDGTFKVVREPFRQLSTTAAGGDTRVQEYLQYVRRNWVDGCWRLVGLERYHAQTGILVGISPAGPHQQRCWRLALPSECQSQPQYHGRLNLYQLLQLLHDEARLVTLAVRLLSECDTSRMQCKSYARLHSRIFQLWDEYSDGSRSASSLLSVISLLTVSNSWC